MLSELGSPIIAIATPPGRGAVGVVRLSGVNLRVYAEQLTQKKLQPRNAHLVSIKDDHEQVIDQVLALYFEAPNSYTGEDVLELQGHGGVVVLHMLVERCLQLAQTTQDNGHALLANLRRAQPGEFTQRAYLNHKLDLAQAEAVADLIDANTQAAVRSANRSLEGQFSKQIQHLQTQVTHLRMQIEACLDFPEEDIDFIEQLQVHSQLQALVKQNQTLLMQAEQGRLLRDGLKIVIAGQPNAGKSSLLNALAGTDVAIVTAVPGTTRDVMSQSIHIDGIPLHVLDTAGLRDQGMADEVEQIGMQRAWDHIADADMVLILNDLSRQSETTYTVQQLALDEKIQQHAGPHTRIIPVSNKTDVAGWDASKIKNTWGISAQTGQGLDELRQEIWRQAGSDSSLMEGVFTARSRHIDALTYFSTHVSQALKLLDQTQPLLDVVAEECRLAQQELSKITGSFTADDLLGEIFSRFCIGK